MSEVSRSVSVLRVRGPVSVRTDDVVAEEVPVALVFNGISHAVMLATPADLEDFALGFSLAEGILDAPNQLYGVDVEPTSDGIALQLEIASEAFVRLKERRRTLAGRTGCGLCGTENLAEVARPIPPLASEVVIRRDAVVDAMRQLAAAQSLQKTTGAVHAAGWATFDGKLFASREDVGRHNALDKVVGTLAKQRVAAADGFFVVTSRASFEMVQKAALAGAPLLAAVSAPTGLAIRTAEAAGLTLLGFTRGDDCVVYSRADRLSLEPESRRADGR